MLIQLFYLDIQAHESPKPQTWFRPKTTNSSILVVSETTFFGKVLFCNLHQNLDDSKNPKCPFKFSSFRFSNFLFLRKYAINFPRIAIPPNSTKRIAIQEANWCWKRDLEYMLQTSDSSESPKDTQNILFLDIHLPSSL